MEKASFLITFDGLESLTQDHEENLSRGRAFVPGEEQLQPGDTCEVVLVHPESGDALEIDAKVENVADEGTRLCFAVTPLVRNRLKKFVGAGKIAPLQERLRNLNPNEVRKTALTGELTERVALERIYGKTVWELLLRNPRLTAPEVARIARMHSLPKPLLELIVNNNTWLKVPQVRRALLSNPRLEPPMARRVFQFTPIPELKIVPMQTAYPMSVRSLAKKLLPR